MIIDFLTALFGGAYYARKYAKEKSDLAAYENRTCSHNLARAVAEARFAAGCDEESRVRDYILSGDNYEEICERFADDFEFVFGSDWRELLCIPPKFYYDEDVTLNSMPYRHTYWVYSLILASQGKIDHGILHTGFLISGGDDKDMCVRFTQRIERYLREQDPAITFMLTKDGITGIEVTPYNFNGGCFKIQELCIYPAFRIWDIDEWVQRQEEAKERYEQAKEEQSLNTLKYTIVPIIFTILSILFLMNGGGAIACPIFSIAVDISIFISAAKAMKQEHSNGCVMMFIYLICFMGTAGLMGLAMEAGVDYDIQEAAFALTILAAMVKAICILCFCGYGISNSKKEM